MYQRKDKWSVGQWMTPNPHVVSPDLSVREAFYTMRAEGYRHLMVLEDNQLVGIVSDRDLRRPDISTEPDGWLDYYNLDENYQVKDVMTSDPKTARSHDPLEKALKLLIFHKISALPVLNKKDELLGIVSTQDMMAAFAAMLEERGDDAKS